MQEFLTSERLEWLCHKARCEEFAQHVADMGYQPCSVLFSTINEKITSIDHQFIYSGSNHDEHWLRRATQARQIFARKQKACRDRLEVIRTTSLIALGGLDGVTSSRLSMIRALLGLLDKHADSSKLSEEERSAINACRSVTGQTADAKFGLYTYYPSLNAVYGEDRSEVAVISRHGCHRDEIGALMAASSTLLGQVRRAIPVCREAADKADRELGSEMLDTVRQLC